MVFGRFRAQNHVKTPLIIHRCDQCPQTDVWIPMKGGFGEVQFSMTPTVPRKLEVPRAKWQMEAEVI